MSNAQPPSHDPVQIAKAWAQWYEGEWVQLSRFPVLLRPVDALDLMGDDGAILDVLREMSQQNVVLKDNDPDSMKKILEALPALKPILERVTRAAVAQPVIAEHPDPERGEIALDMIYPMDRLIIFGHVFQEGVQAGFFPGQPAGSVAATPDLEGLRAAARELGRLDGQS